MRKITTSTLLALLLLAGTAPESRAQQTNAAASLAPQADSTSCMQHEERPQTVNEMRRQRGLTEKHNLFVPRGQWIFGGTASYSTHSNDTYRFLVIEGIESKGYTFKVSPMIAYAFRDNMALGGRFIYSRSLLKLDKADLNLGGEDSDLNFELNDCYSLQQSYSVAMIWRQYIPLGPQQAFRALQRDAALGRRYAGTLCQGLPGEGHLPDGLYLLAGHLARVSSPSPRTTWPSRSTSA